MYWKLLLAYGVAFLLLGGYLLYLNQRIGHLESRLEDVGV